AGNFIGTDPSGMADAGLEFGISVEGPNNTIGGTTPADRNVISGNDEGIVLGGRDAVANLILGNFIGTDATGTVGLGIPDDLAGIDLDGNGADTTIGGTTPEARNVISGNGQYGIRSTSDRPLIQGNYIGVDRTGLKPLGNSGIDITLLNTG